jgi:predicted  nucleic acid-binding Zn-ribbon protein
MKTTRPTRHPARLPLIGWILIGWILIGWTTSAGSQTAGESPSPSAADSISESVPDSPPDSPIESRPPLNPSTAEQLEGHGAGTAMNAVATRETRLKNVLAARARIEDELRAVQEQLGSGAARGREQDIEQRIRNLSEDLAELDRNFAELASGVDPQNIAPRAESSDLNLSTEVRDLLGPLLNELKRATRRPREIDRLRTDIAQLRSRLDYVDRALAQLEQVRQEISDPALLEAIEAEQQRWQRDRGSIHSSLQVAQQKLDQRLSESQSIAQAIENVFELFFKSRGRNLLLALLATIAFVLAFRRLRRFMGNRRILSQRAGSFEGRLFSVLYSVFTVLGAVLVFLIALYLFGDWVLLILMLLLILGLIWTSKQAIPRFWTQTVLMLDMGPVREGERVHYRGLPWRVDRISFYSILSNPALVGGMIRLPIDDLAELRSRGDREDEPWFPTNPDDVVLLPDGRPAQVEFQSIDTVRLRVPGRNRLIVPAAEFAGQTVERLTDGYRVGITFGLDYGDQAGITTTIRETLQRKLEEKWHSTPWVDSLRVLGVQFKEAGPSSLDLFVHADLDGSTAFEYLGQKRTLATFCVDACNEEGWVIPFSQLTLHVAPAQDPAADASDPS